MSLTYIRIARTPDVEKVLTDLHNRFSLLNESEIIRLALSEAHNKEFEAKMAQEQKVRKAFYSAIEKGGKAGDTFIAKKGIKRENMTEQELYDAIFKSSDDNA